MAVWEWIAVAVVAAACVAAMAVNIARMFSRKSPAVGLSRKGTPAESGLGSDWGAETPLWYYVFKEAESRAGGEHLGPVGGGIVAEVLLGLLDADPGSYRRAQPGWRPELPASQPGDFTMADLVVFADGPSGEGG